MEKNDSNKGNYFYYLRLLRIDHWIKNLFLIPGAAIAISFVRLPSGSKLLGFDYLSIFLSFIALCIASSANYVINEWLDRSFDAKHPFKNHRVANHYTFNAKNIYLLYFFLIVSVVFVMYFLNRNTNLYLAFLLVMGVLYNVKPFRTKDIKYLDVISESVNNPIRLAIGWHSVVPNLPVPASAFISFWGIGIFLMSLKRYSEFKLINDKVLLSTYRKSFESWTAEKLLSFSITGALISAAFAGILLAKYRLEYVLLFPIVFGTFGFYLNKSLHLDPISYAPEKLMKDKKLIMLVLILGATFVYLTFKDLNFLYNLFGIEKN